jgi:hypothetical protein
MADTKAAYYHPAMCGSWSLKAALPAFDAVATVERRSWCPWSSQKENGGRRGAESAERLKAYCATYGTAVLKAFLCKR